MQILNRLSLKREAQCWPAAHHMHVAVLIQLQKRPLSQLVCLMAKAEIIVSPHPLPRIESRLLFYIRTERGGKNKKEDCCSTPKSVPSFLSLSRIKSRSHEVFSFSVTHDMYAYQTIKVDNSVVRRRQKKKKKEKKGDILE